MALFKRKTSKLIEHTCKPDLLAKYEMKKHVAIGRGAYRSAADCSDIQRKNRTTDEQKIRVYH